MGEEGEKEGRKLKTCHILTRIRFELKWEGEREGGRERERESGALPSFLLSFPQIVCKHLAFRPFSSFSFLCCASTLPVGVTNELPWSRVAVTPARPPAPARPLSVKTIFLHVAPLDAVAIVEGEAGGAGCRHPSVRRLRCRWRAAGDLFSRPASSKSAREISRQSGVSRSLA